MQTSLLKKAHILNKPLFHVASIIFLVLLVYSNTLEAPFQLDDYHNIVRHPANKDLRYFSDPELINRLDINLKQLFKSRYVGYLTFALNYSMHGIDVKGYHLVNIFIHILNSLLLYWLVTLTFMTPFFSVSGRTPAVPDETRGFIALFTALFFAVHPIQTQAVTYIVQRFTSLAALFYLFSLALYIKWRVSREQRTKGPASGVLLYTVSLLSAVLAMKTKEFAFTLPIMMVLYEVLFFGGKITKRASSLTPFFLAVLLIPLALADTGSVASLGGINEEALNMSGARLSISRADYLFTQCRVVATYIRLLVFPVNQNIDYDYPISHSFFSTQVVLSFLLLLSILLSGIYLYHRSKRPERTDNFLFRLIAFGIFWFFITLFAESGVVPISDVIFEHRVYLPSIGFSMALTAAIGAAREKWGSRTKYAVKTVVSIMLTAILTLSAVAYARNDDWRDGIRLWSKAVEGSPNKARTHCNLGVAYLDKGRYDEAIKEFQIVLVQLPYFAKAHSNLGLAYNDLGRTDDAIKEFQTVLMLDPNEFPLAPKFIEMLQKKKLDERSKE